jgi:hypothetical protein
MSAPVWVPNWPSTAVTCGIPGQWPWASSIVAVRTPGDGHGRVHRPGREFQRTRGIAARGPSSRGAWSPSPDIAAFHERITDRQAGCR